MKLDLSIFENVKKIQVSLQSAAKKGTLHEDQYPLLYHISLISSKRNVLDQSCTEHQKTHFAFRNFRPPTLQQWLHERAPILHYTITTYLINNVKGVKVIRVAPLYV
jgi:hypothetical protein